MTSLTLCDDLDFSIFGCNGSLSFAILSPQSSEAFPSAPLLFSSLRPRLLFECWWFESVPDAVEMVRRISEFVFGPLPSFPLFRLPSSFVMSFGLKASCLFPLSFVIFFFYTEFPSIKLAKLLFYCWIWLLKIFLVLGNHIEILIIDAASCVNVALIFCKVVVYIDLCEKKINSVIWMFILEFGFQSFEFHNYRLEKILA